MTLDARTKALLDAARPGFEPRPEDAARNEAAMVALLGAGAAANVSAAGAFGSSVGKALGAAKSAAVGIGSKVIVGALVVSAAGLGTIAWRAGASADRPRRDGPAPDASSISAASSAAVEPPPRAPASVASASATAVGATSPAPPAATTAPSPTVSGARAARRPSPPRNAPPPTNTKQTAAGFDVEVALVRRGTARLSAGDPGSALDAFDEHARTFPHGVLEEERAAGRVRALCSLGRAAEARMEADRFDASYPGSPYVASIRSSCASSR